MGVMEPRHGWACFAFFFFSLFILSAGQRAGNASASPDSLDYLIRDHAFKVLVKRRTGVMYPVPLPANLSGIGASVVRLRSGSLWSRGANSTAFLIPPRVMLVPYARRLAIVFYQDMGNRSSSYYKVPGHSLVAPVVGLLAYDASSTGELDFVVMGDPISVNFPETALPEGANSTVIKCASFGPHGSVRIANAASRNVCLTNRSGHFAIIVPSPVSSPPLVVKEGGGSRWRVWLAASVVGVVGLVVVGLVGRGIWKVVRHRKVEVMERKAEDGEAFGTVWVEGRKMPSATMMRTQPVIEEED